jgi:hypothetical protein
MKRASQMGAPQEDKAHSPNYELPFHEHCLALGVESYFVYPGSEPIRFESTTDFLIKKLTGE